MTESRQRTYYRVYRNRQSCLHHTAYMRLAKVLGILRALDRQAVNLDGKQVFDYGFGAGTFFHHCPKTAFLHGVELDPVNVQHVMKTLRAKKHAHVDLRVVEETRWRENELLNRQYDLVVVSHVLEHIKDPADLLKCLIACLRTGGCLVAALPIHERVKHDNHEWVIDDALVREWAAAAGAEIVDSFEFDSVTQWALPVFEKKSRAGRIAAQTLSLFLGLCAAAVGMRCWLRLDALAARMLGAEPGQAVYVLKPAREKD
jgi:2-polyprenyl-3-methyl-5-hydroxy-6-metoxy-1,4-benzoquinol methylase